MSLYFLVNNFHFAFGMIGVIVLITAAWLSLDAYKLRNDQSSLLRFLGVTFMALWQVIHSLNFTNDLVLYFGFVVFIVGLILLVISFLKIKQLALNAVVVIPAFSLYSLQLHFFATVLLLSTAYLSFRQWKRDFNPTWKPLALSFLLLGVASLFNIFGKNISQTSFLYILTHFVELFGFLALGFWVWQFMRLRIHESIIMILISVTFILATIVTLAFSTILISRISTETASNLLTDVKVLDLAIGSMKEEALAKTTLISVEDKIVQMVDINDTAGLDEAAGEFLEKYKLGFLIITDKDGGVIVRAHALSKRGDTLVGERALEEALLRNTYVTIEDGAVEGLSIRASAPILKQNKVIGVVVAGFPFDNAMADNMKRLTGLEMFIYSGDKSVAGTVFDADGRTRLVGETLDSKEVRSAVLEEGKAITSSVEIYGNPFHASYLPLVNSDEKVVGMLSVAKPEQDIVNIANATNRLTLITVLLILLILLLPIYRLSKRFSSGLDI